MGKEKSTNKAVFFGWKGLERVLYSGIGLVVQIILARILLPESFGSLAMIVALTNFADIFVQSGLSTALIRKKDELTNEEVSTALICSLSVAVFLYFLLFLLAPIIADFYNNDSLIWPLRIQGIVLILQAIYSIQAAIMSRNFQFKSQCFATIVSVTVAGIVGIVMAFLGFEIWALVVHNVLYSILIVVSLAVVSKIRISPSFSIREAKALYSFGGKILLANIITGLYDSLRSLIIGRKYTADDLAYYDKAYTYSGYVTQVSNLTISSVLLPIISKEQGNIRKVKELARKYNGIIAAIMFPLLVGFSLVSEEFVKILLTEKWSACIPLLAIFCLLRIPGNIITIDKQIYFALGKSHIVLFYELFICILNLLNIIITIQFGVYYIAIGCLFVEYLGFIVICIISRSVLSYKIKERVIDLLKPSIAVVVMSISVWCLNYFVINAINIYALLLIKIAVGAVIYFISLAVLRDRNLMLFMSVFIKRFRSFLQKKGGEE